jgi:hypothetical protein
VHRQRLLVTLALVIGCWRRPKTEPLLRGVPAEN